MGTWASSVERNSTARSFQRTFSFKALWTCRRLLLSEQALKRHVSRLLAQNTSTEDAISFLGAGCYKRYIPAVCDEIANRSEFPHRLLRRYLLRPRKNAGDLRVRQHDGGTAGTGCGQLPHHDAGQAVSSSFRMALRLRPGRNEILVPAHMNPETAPGGRLLPPLWHSGACGEPLRGAGPGRPSGQVSPHRRSLSGKPLLI